MTRLRKIRLHQSGIFDSIADDPVPFVVFGLQLQPESSTLVRGQFHQDMLAVVRDIALSLPVSHRLYVKEHDVMFGHRPIHFYQSLKEIPNVVCVSPYESGPALIRRADAAVCVTGSFGWDAALLGKPAIVLGEPFFAAYPGVDHVTDLTALPEVFQRRLSGDYRHSETDLECFVAATQAVTVDADMDSLWGGHGSAREADVANLARALLAYRDVALPDT